MLSRPGYRVCLCSIGSNDRVVFSVTLVTGIGSGSILWAIEKRNSFSRKVAKITRGHCDVNSNKRISGHRTNVLARSRRGTKSKFVATIVGAALRGRPSGETQKYLQHTLAPFAITYRRSPRL